MKTVLTLEGTSLKKLHGGGGVIHPNELIFGAYNELSLYFKLVETTWFLIGFYGNHSRYKRNVTSGWHIGFSNWLQIFFIFELNTENGEKTFSDWNLQKL